MFFERGFFIESMLLLCVAPLAMFGLAVPYIVARMREKSGPPDPHIGLKTAHHFFMTAGIFLMLTGFTVICVSFLTLDAPARRPGTFLDQEEIRVAFALITVGGLFAVLHALM